MTKKRKKLIIIMLIAAAVLTVIYFAVLSPIIKKMNTSEDNPEELLQGELLDSSGNITVSYTHLTLPTNSRV